MMQNFKSFKLAYPILNIQVLKASEKKFGESPEKSSLKALLYNTAKKYLFRQSRLKSDQFRKKIR